jgi:type VI secretion system secreted protein Hcp
MAIDAFMKIEGVVGESVVKGMEGQIDLLSWKWGVEQHGSMHTAKGGGTGKADVHDLTFVHVIDKASPTLMQFCCSGKHFSKAALTMRKAGDSPLNYLTITLTNVLISHVSMRDAQGSEQLSEEVGLNFSEFSYVYQPQDENGGKSGGPITATWISSVQNTVSKKKANPTFLALPGHSVGYYSYSPPGSQFGTKSTNQTLQRIGNLWAAYPTDDGPSYQFGVGDMSYVDGHAMKPHKSHRDGRCADIRPIRKDRKHLPVTYQSDDYDREEAARLIQLFFLNPNVEFILFNDSKIPRVKPYPGHDNHFHVKFKS